MSNLTTLLFYTCVTKEIANQCLESFTLDQAESANRGFTANFTTIEAGFKVGMASLFDVHDIFFVNGKGMRPDWEAAWKGAVTQLAPFIEKKAVVGFFIGDELFPGKISVQNFTTALKAVQAVKEQYAGYGLFSWLNEGGTGWVQYVQKQFGGMFPPELDVFSIDDYNMNVSAHRAFYEGTIYPMMHAHQSAWLVPGSYSTAHGREKSVWCCGGSTAADCDACIVQRTQDFWAWAQSDHRVTGLAPWHWDTRGVDEVSTYKEIGTVDMPQTRAEWRKIGKVIRSNAAAARRADGA